VDALVDVEGVTIDDARGDEAGVVKADVDEDAEVGNVGDDAGEGHARREIGGVDEGGEVQGLEGVAGLAARLGELGEDEVALFVGDGRPRSGGGRE
jgi:hypothetical protein